jgi:LysM repeat protein
MSGKRKVIEAGMSAIKKEAAVLAKAKKKAAALAEAEKKAAAAVKAEKKAAAKAKKRESDEILARAKAKGAKKRAAQKRESDEILARAKAKGAKKRAAQKREKAADSQLGPVVPIKPGSADDILDKAWTKKASTTPVTPKKVTGGTSKKGTSKKKAPVTPKRSKVTVGTPKKGTSKKKAPLLTKKEKLGIGVAALATAGTGYKLYQLNTKSHSVKSGDTLSQLAKKNNITLKKLLEANPNIKDPNKIRVGQKIKIPFGMTKKPVYKGLSKKEMASMAMPKVKGGRGFKKEKSGERAKAAKSNLSYNTPDQYALDSLGGVRATGGKVTNPARIKSTIRMTSGGGVGSKLIDDIYNA